MLVTVGNAAFVCLFASSNVLDLFIVIFIFIGQQKPMHCAHT